MIDKSYIDSAREIKKEFTELSDKLSEYQNYIEQLLNNFRKIANDLEHWRKNDLMKEESVQSAGNFMISKLDEIEQETEKLNKKIDPINKKIEKLREEELKLYKLIKERYPNLTDSQIIRQIHENI